jgi:hypothetical protein
MLMVKQKMLNSENKPSNQIFFVLGRFPHRLSKHQLNKVLKLLVNVAANGVSENSFLKY